MRHERRGFVVSPDSTAAPYTILGVGSGQIDAAVAHRRAKVVVPIGAVQAIATVKVHHIGHVGQVVPGARHARRRVLDIDPERSHPTEPVPVSRPPVMDRRFHPSHESGPRVGVSVAHKRDTRAQPANWCQ